MENTIKSITPVKCPHCAKEIYVEFEMKPTVLNDLFTPEQMAEAKAEVIRQIDDLNLEQEKKDNILDWVAKPETIFGPKEIDPIIESLKKNMT